MASMSVSMTGWDEAIDKLKGMSPQLQKKCLRPAARTAMNIVRDEARRNVPVDSGLTKRNIITTVSTKRDFVSARVGVRGGGKKQSNNPFYWRFIELGTQYIEAKPFLQPALTKNIQAVTNKMAEAISLELSKL